MNYQRSDKNAFPSDSPLGDIEGGLTKLEYFMAKAMQAILSNNEYSVSDANIDRLTTGARAIAEAFLAASKPKTEEEACSPTKCADCDCGK